jgi:Na+/pantothenate symporter
MRQLGKMPAWQRAFVITGMLTCSITGGAYLLGHEFQIERSLLGNHLVLASHGLAAILASIALGSVLPFHLKAGYQSTRKRLSGFTQLGFLFVLVITGGMLYYGPAELRDSTIQLHWLTGLVFFAIFIFHAFTKWSLRASSMHLPK